MKITKKDSKTFVKSKKMLPSNKKSVYVRKSLGTVLFTISEPETRGNRQLADAGMDITKRKPKKKLTLFQKIIRRLTW